MLAPTPHLSTSLAHPPSSVLLCGLPCFLLLTASFPTFIKFLSGGGGGSVSVPLSVVIHPAYTSESLPEAFNNPWAQAAFETDDTASLGGPGVGWGNCQVPARASGSEDACAPEGPSHGSQAPASSPSPTRHEVGHDRLCSRYPEKGEGPTRAQSPPLWPVQLFQPDPYHCCRPAVSKYLLSSGRAVSRSRKALSPRFLKDTPSVTLLAPLTAQRYSPGSDTT